MGGGEGEGGRVGSGGGAVGLGDQDGCERRIEVFVKLKKKWMGGSGRGGGQGRCYREVKFFCEN